MLKRIFGFTEVRYRVLANNAHRLVVASAKVNLYTSRWFLLRLT